jgi:hypothetical protein
MTRQSWRRTRRKAPTWFTVTTLPGVTPGSSAPGVTRTAGGSSLARRGRAAAEEQGEASADHDDEAESD